MSAVTEFLTQPSFWWGGLAGALVTGVVAPLNCPGPGRLYPPCPAARERV
jgi:hypothetical protein